MARVVLSPAECPVPVIGICTASSSGAKTRHPQEKLDKLETTLAASGLALPEVVPLLAALLSLPLPAHYPALTLTPQQQRQKTLETLLTWLAAEAERQPVLVIVEDLHWIDPSTLELLSLLIDQVASARLCLVLTARPEFRPPWTMVAHLTALTLRRFAPAQVTRLASHVAGDKALPPAVLEEVVRKTDGVPLFVEELTKVVLESGLLQEQEDHYDLTGPLPPLAIPATLHDALMARLDRLAAAKLVAQLGAVIGRTFAYDLLQAVAPLDEATLQGALAQLVEAELVAQRGMPPQATYTFKHALIQDAAYQSLLRSTRQQYHQRIAQVLEEQFPDDRRDAARAAGASLHRGRAHGAGHPLLAAGRAAGPAALGQPGSGAAPHHGPGAAGHAPETSGAGPAGTRSADRPGAGVDGHQGLCGPGGGADLRPGAGVVRAGRRDAPALPDAAGLMSVLSEPGSVADGAGAGGTALRAWRSVRPTPTALLEAHDALGTTLFYLGDYAAARTHLEQGIALIDPSGAAGPGAPPWRGAWGAVPGDCGPDAVVPGLSGAGAAAEPGGAGTGPGAGPSLQSGDGPALCGLPASPPPRSALRSRRRPTPS